jgi:hypothetical protein
MTHADTRAEIGDALERLRAANDQRSSHDAYSAFLYSVGNNHAGTYRPIVLDAISEAAPLLREASPWTCRAILEAFIDLNGSFGPEQGCEEFEGRPLRQLVSERIASLRPDIEAAARRADEASSSADELLGSL